MRSLANFLFTALFIISCANFTLAGQVVTEESRQWAKKVVEEESSIQAVDNNKTIAILYFNNKTGDQELDPLRKGLTFMLITDLSTVKSLNVIERVKLQALIEEVSLGESGLVMAETSPKTGKMLGAHWIVGGDIMSMGNVPIHVSSSLLDVPDSELVGQPTAEGMLANFFEIEKNLLFKIIDLLKIELSDEEIEILRRPITMNQKALLDLFKAIDESDKGNYEQAEKYYKSSLKRDSDIASAKESLTELRSLGMISPLRNESLQLLQAVRNTTSLTDQQIPDVITKREQTPEDTRIPITIEVPVPML